MTRQADFDLSLETSTPATSPDPSAATDLVAKGFADNNYMQGGRAVADVAALKAVAVADRHDNDIRLVDSLNALFKFDSASSEAGDDATVITPTVGTGRWLITTSSGSGGGGNRNYLQDSGSDNAENNIGDWVTYADAAATTPVDGTGGSATATFTRNTTTPLRQTGDFKLTVDAVNRQGNGASVDFIVDRADRNKVLGIWMDIDATDANYADDDLQVFIYDKDTSTLITPYSPANAHKIKGNKYRFRCAFSPADTSSANYRLIIHVASTNATGYSVYFDNFEVGPGNNLQYGFDGIWKPYTASDFTVAAVTGSPTVDDIRLIPKKDTQGNWYLEGFALVSFGSTAGNVAFSVAGMQTLNSASYNLNVQLAVTGYEDNHRILTSGSTTVFEFSSSAAATIARLDISVPLQAKPTWADFDPIATFYPTTDDLAVTPWQAYTPASFQGFNSLTSRLQWRYNHDSLEITGDMTIGTVADAEARIQLPNNEVANLKTATTGTLVFGWLGRDSTGTIETVVPLAIHGQNYLAFGATTDNSTGENVTTARNGNAIFASSSRLTFFASIPINRDLGALSPIGLEMASATTPGIIKKNIFEAKTSTPTTVASSNAVHSFTGLTAGNVYTLKTVINSSTAATVQLRENSTQLTTLYGPSGNNTYSGVVEFVATGTTADVYVAGGTVTRVGGTFRSSLKEHRDTVITTDF